MNRILGGAGAALGAKVLTGIAVAAAAVTVAGAATEVATTGSLNPQNWGQQVTQQVEHCKATLRASGTRGIGQCVSQFAKQHGQAVASAARHHGQGNDDGASNSANGKSHAKDKGKNHGGGSGDTSGDSSSGTNEPAEAIDWVHFQTQASPRP